MAKENTTGFMDGRTGAGRTGMMQAARGHNNVGFDLNPEYAVIAQKRGKGRWAMFCKGPRERLVVWVAC